MNKLNKCSVCHSKTIPKNITYTQWHKGELIAVENVPAEVCQNCGEEYFSPDIVGKIQKVIELHSSSKTIKVPVFQLP
jgi:YgiT-type zinc finger domain-containing protein